MPVGGPVGSHSFDRLAEGEAQQQYDDRDDQQLGEQDPASLLVSLTRASPVIWRVS